MLLSEWLAIGYEKGLIDELPQEEYVYFNDVYVSWFKAKMNTIKPQSLDRIECTYNRYFLNSDFVKMPLHLITEKVIYDFINDIIIRYGNITYKEYTRIYQILNNVIVYANGLNIGYCKPINWDIVKRYVAKDNIVRTQKKEYVIPFTDRQTLFKSVLQDNIYPEKYSTCLCILLNFYLGLRIGELSALQWSDVDFKGRCIYIHNTYTKSYKRDVDGNKIGTINYYNQDTTKTISSTRKIPLVNDSIYLLNLIKSHQEHQNISTSYVCYSNNSIISKNIERTIRRLCSLAGVNVFSSHKIRKTFASELHKNGVPTKMISDIMGHSEMRTTEKYYIINYDDCFDYIRKAINNIAIKI